MNRKLYWGLGILMILLIGAGGFISGYKLVKHGDHFHEVPIDAPDTWQEQTSVVQQEPLPPFTPQDKEKLWVLKTGTHSVRSLQRDGQFQKAHCQVKLTLKVPTHFAKNFLQDSPTVRFIPMTPQS